MMKPSPELRKILAWTLDGQLQTPIATPVAATLTDERIEEALKGTEALNAEERILLLRLPGARARFRFLYEAHRAEQILRWKELSVTQSLSLRAAAGGAIEPVTLENEDFKLTLLPLDPQGDEWILHLKLTGRLVSELAGARLRVRGDEGNVWMTGRTDRDGELSAPWSLEGSPLDHLARNRVLIEPA